MPEKIPKRIDHYRYTDKGVVIKGEFPQKELSRLSDVVTDNSGNIKYQLEFGIDALQNRYIRGRISTQVILQCQRCLKNYLLDIDSTVSLAFVHMDFDAQRAEESALEPFFVDKKELVDPRILIEDELLLALPQIPTHPYNDEDDGNSVCQIKLDYPPGQTNSRQTRKETDSIDNEQMEKENPFAVLKKLQH
jgi:uncharacterized protein